MSAYYPKLLTFFIKYIKLKKLPKALPFEKNHNQGAFIMVKLIIFSGWKFLTASYRHFFRQLKAAPALTLIFFVIAAFYHLTCLVSGKIFIGWHIGVISGTILFFLGLPLVGYGEYLRQRRLIRKNGNEIGSVKELTARL